MNKIFSSYSNGKTGWDLDESICVWNDVTEDMPLVVMTAAASATAWKYIDGHYVPVVEPLKRKSKFWFSMTLTILSLCIIMVSYAIVSGPVTQSEPQDIPISFIPKPPPMELDLNNLIFPTVQTRSNKNKPVKPFHPITNKCQMKCAKEWKEYDSSGDGLRACRSRCRF